MAKALKNKNATATPKTVAMATPAGQVNGAAIWAFINTHAAGQANNVQIVLLPNAAKGVPFGNNGKAGGVRQTVQGWVHNGHANGHTVGAVLGAGTKLGHSRKNPVCLMAYLNGGYSPSCSTWGTAFAQLVVSPQPTK